MALLLFNLNNLILFLKCIKASGANGKSKKKSLLRMSSPEIFQDSDGLFDSDSNAPHVRVKRIANSIDTPARSNEKSSPSYTVNRSLIFHIPIKMSSLRVEI